MRIYSMTATFGKLEHQTQTFQPGLNIIEAPNEWGKSTWCAFLVAMLYGIDTRERTTGEHLADKERYTPWSGQSMSGRIDLRWQCRDITIERTTKGRIPMGQFRAYETKTGLPVPELTAANCGQQLLGVERSVFLRTGFLRLSDMPVTQDEALLARLSALVTTGDESSTAALLASRLRELKNRCRYNRSGLLPQAEAERDALEKKIAQLDSLQAQSRHLTKRIQLLEDHTRQLLNHQEALAYASAQDNLSRLTDARSARQTILARLQQLEQRCNHLPPKETLEADMLTLQQLQSQLSAALLELQRCNAPETAGNPLQAELDNKKHTRLRSPVFLIFAVLSLLAAAAGGVLLYLSYGAGKYLLPIGAVLSILFLTVHLLRASRAKKLENEYGSADTRQWIADAQTSLRRTETRQALECDIDCLNGQILALTGGQDAARCLIRWQDAVSAHSQLQYARQEYLQAVSLEETLSASVHPVQQPALPDPLDHAPEETAQLLAEDRRQLHQLQLKLGQCQGQMAQLGSPEDAKRQLEQVNSRIARLEETYQALTLAQQTLAKAQDELQRRFAPQITAQARELMSRLTQQRYDRLTLDQNLSLSAGAENEDTLHSALWRSDGTADQLYLALRLAVAKVLTPDAPLILDDALVRFDDIRLKAALDILKEEAQHKQVILFTCQSREKNLL